MTSFVGPIIRTILSLSAYVKFVQAGVTSVDGILHAVSGAEFIISILNLFLNAKQEENLNDMAQFLNEIETVLAT